MTRLLPWIQIVRLGLVQASIGAIGGLVGTGASDLARQLLGSPAQAYTAVFLGEALIFGLAARLAAGAFPRADHGAPEIDTVPVIRVRDTSRWAT